MKDKMKIIEIQKEYIGLIQSYFKKEISDVSHFDTPIEFEKYAAKTKANSILVGNYARPKTVFENKFEKLLSDLDQHWIKYEDNINTYCINTNANKVTIWPDEEVLKLSPKLLLYYDTVLVPDPLSNLGRVVIENGYYRDALIYFSIVNKLEELLSNAFDVPLIIFFNYKKSAGSKFICSNLDMASKYLESQTGEIARSTFLEIIGQQFEFSGLDSLHENLIKTTLGKLKKSFNHEILNKFLYTFITEPTFLQQAYAKGMLDFVTHKRLQQNKLNLKDYLDIFSILTSVYAVYEAREFNTIELNSVNLITNIHIPFSEYKYRRICKDYSNVLQIKKENIINYSLSQNFDWVDHIDFVKCIEIRKKGDFNDFRKILADSANKLKLSSFEDFPAVSQEYEKEVKGQLEEQNAINDKRIKEIKSKRKTSAISFGITAGLTITSIAFPSILPLTLLSAGYGIVAGASAKDLVNELLTGKSKLKELGNRSLSIILKNIDNS